MKQEKLLSTKEAIRQRRSIRKFKPDPVPDKCITALLESARLAPSGCNAQPWRFKNPEMNYPAASYGVSSSLLGRHSVLDTESSRVFWIPAFAGMTHSPQAAGNTSPRENLAFGK